MKNTTTIILSFLPFLLFAQSPNFVFILADDMGWNGTSVQLSLTENGSKSDFYETTNLEELAADGMTFSQGYAPASKCSPTRCSILTGESPARNSFTETGNSIATGEILIEPSTNNSIESNDITIAEWLKTIGLNYRTGHYGKWHLGSDGPAAHGFDFEDGNNSNNDGNAANGNTIQNDPKTMFDLTDKGIQFMQDAVTDGVPFYLQLSHYAVHGGVETTQGSFDYFDAKAPGAIHDNAEFAGMTKDLDETIGLILDEIEDLGIAGNTYVIFISDNGAGGLSDNAPLSNGKATIYEGGIRVPVIIRGPNIPASTNCTTPVNGYDLFPTIAEWTGSGVALPSTLDGQSIVPLLTQNSFTRTDALYFHLPHYSGNLTKIPRSAAVEDNYKLVIDYESGVDFLYDLDTDIGELTNIAASNPLIVEHLKVKLRDHLKSVNANMPTLNPTHPNFSGTGTDVDADGLEDEWEFTELLSHTFTATDDPDGDGDDNLTEFMNGTDPLISGGGSGPVTIDDEGFELGWGIWNDGGADARRNNNDAPYANNGSFCIRLRDDDPLSSFMTTNVLDLSLYDELTFDFSYYVSSFENTEEFWLQISQDGGATYTTIEDWVNTVDFVNDERHDPSLLISGPFTSNCTFRFRCNANRNNDWVYIDDVKIVGTIAAPNSMIINTENPNSLSFEVGANTLKEQKLISIISDMRLFPNPTRDHLTIEFVLAEAADVQLVVTDFSGRVVVKNKLNLDMGHQRTEINSTELEEGYYFVQLISERGRFSDRFVVIR